MKERLALLRNVAWVAMAGYIEAAVGLLAGVLIARTLGPTDFGHYAFAIWLCGALIMAGNNGLPATSIKYIAEARGAGRAELTAALVSRFTRLQLASSGLVLSVFAVVMAISPVSDWRDALPLMLGIAIVAAWSRAGFWMWGSIGKGHELFAPENLTLSINAILNMALVIALAWKGATIAEFFALYAGLGVVSNLVLRFMLGRRGIRAVPGPVPVDMERRLRRHLILTGIMMLLIVGTNRGVEMSLLKVYASAEEVGYFAIAGSLTKGAVELLAGGMSAVLLSTMSRRFGEGGQAALGGMLTESTRVYWLVGLAIAGLGLTVSAGLVNLLYGYRYDDAVPALMWNLVIAGLMVVNGAASAVLTASDRQADRIRIVLLALAINLIAGIVLIPRYGLAGAIASLALTQLSETAIAWSYVFRRVRFRLPVGPMARQALAAVIATALAHLATEALHRKLDFIGGAAVFLLTYLALCVVLRTLRASEFEVIAHVVGRLGRLGARLSGRIAGLSRFALAE